MSFCGASISSENLSGATTEVTFRPCSGGTISLGTQVFPFNYVNEYYFGTYDCYVPLYDYVYTVEVPCPSATPTPTPTVTPTATPWDYCYSFNGGFNDQTETVIEYEDGKLLFGGIFTTYSGQSFNRIVRLNSDATIDNTFDVGTGFDSDVYALAIQPDGKILVGGFFDTYNGTPAGKIIRLNSDGSVDNTFDTGTGFTFSVFAITVQSDNKILVGGGFATYNGQDRRKIVRLNTDGTLDDTFNTNTGMNNIVYNIYETNDNKIFVLGSFTVYSGVTSNNFVKLNNDGTIDNTFDVGTGFNSETFSAVLEDDGKILVVGLFTSFDGQSSRQIARLNSDGSFDNTFDCGSGFSRISGLSSADTAVKYNDKYFITGDFNTYSGISANGLIRLNYDGTKDNSFDYGTGLTFLAGSFNLGYVLNNGSHLVVGEFSEYNGSQVGDIVFLNPFGGSLNCPYPTPTPTTTATSTPTPTPTVTPT